MRHPTRSRSRKNRTAQFLEQLESRILLNGLTVITHGYEPLSNSRPSWIDAMGNAVAQVAGPNTAIYTLRLEPTNASTVHVSEFTRLSGPANITSTNGEIVLLLDWAAVSGIVTQTYSVTYLASVVTPYLTGTFPDIGLTAPLAEGSIQLIGHSRGAPLVSQIAKDLGQSGIWVDQVTTLDPVPSPFNSDPAVSLGSNVIFADNYYQNSGDGLLVPNGSRVSGALNIGPLSLSGAYGILDGGTHNDVHLFYQGTIGGSTSDGSYNVPASWYASNGLSRATTGFYYSRLGGGVRPAAGIGSAFGGTAARSSITRSGPQWPNLAFVTPSAASIGEGQSLSTSFRYQDYNANSTVQWYLDTDPNPYNGNSIAIGDAAPYAATGNSIVSANVNLTPSAPAGVYYLEGVITNGTETRYSYSAATITITTEPTQVAFVQLPATSVLGSPITPPLTVAIEDASGHVVVGDASTVTLSRATGPGILAGTLTAQAHNGIATFAGLSLSALGDYTFHAADGALAAATSTTLTVVAPPPHLLFTQQPAAGVARQALAPSISITAEDYTDAILTSDTSAVTLSMINGPAGGTLTGALTAQLQDGVATFNNVSFSKPGTYTLQASDGSFAGATSAAITITLPATHLVFLKQPASAIAGQTIAPAFTVAIEDSSGHIVAADNSTISLAILSGPTGTGGAFNGTLAVQANNGVAAFGDLSLTRAGTYVFLASDGLLTGARSHNITITPDASTGHLILLQSSGTTIVGNTLSPAILLNVVDQYDNLIKTDHSQASLTIQGGPASGAFSGTTTVNVSKGAAAFKNARLTMAGTYTIAATDASLAIPAPLTFTQVITPGVATVPAPHLASSYPFNTATFSTTLKSTANAIIPFLGVASLVDQNQNLLGTATLTPAGLARFTLTNLTLGTYVCTITYAGDANHTAVDSSAFNLRIVAAPTKTTLAVSATQLAVGQSLTLSATVGASSASSTARTGTITFRDGTTVLGVVALDANSSAALTLTPAAIGRHSYTATYSGDANFKLSASSSRTVTIQKDATLATLTSSLIFPPTPGETFTLTATVVVLSPSTGIPTGTIVFKDGNKTLGTAPLDPAATATLTTSLSTLGVHKLTAVYSGDLQDSAATGLLTLTVIAPLVPTV